MSTKTGRRCGKCDLAIMNEAFEAGILGEDVEQVFERANGTLGNDRLCDNQTDACQRLQQVKEVIVALATEYNQ